MTGRGALLDDRHGEEAPVDDDKRGGVRLDDREGEGRGSPLDDREGEGRGASG